MHATGQSEQGKRKARVGALEKLNDVQRHYFNMKKGFEGDEDRADVHKARDLYDSLPEIVKGVLRVGFGPEIGDLFRETEIKIKEEWLVDDGQEDEINCMLTELLSLV